MTNTDAMVDGEAQLRKASGGSKWSCGDGVACPMRGKLSTDGSWR